MASKRNNKINIKTFISKEKIFEQPLSQKEQIALINSHTNFTRRFVSLLIRQSDIELCREKKGRYGK